VPVQAATYGPAIESTTVLDGFDIAFCLVQPLPGDRLLAVGSRRGSSPNGAIFDGNGDRTAAVDFADGIQHLLTTPSGLVWVGYFDEGVYGDSAVGHHGIVCYTTDGTPIWKYPFDTAFGPVDDCYALNVAGEIVWSSYYSSFPIVRVADGVVTGWHNPVRGATAMIAADDRAALVGGYDHPDRLVVGALGDQRFEPLDPLRLTAPDGTRLPPDTRFEGRGQHLHAFAGTHWYRLDLDQIS
jgi:hypothetical protein